MRILAIHAGMHDCVGRRVRRLRAGRGGVGGALHARRRARARGAVARDRRGAAHRRLVAPRRRCDRHHARLVLDARTTSSRCWRELHYTLERWRGRERTHRELAVLCHRFGIADHAHAVPRRSLPEGQFVPAGHADPFRQSPRGARARGAVLHRLERRAGLYVGRHRRQCQLFDAWPEGRQARMPLRRRPLAHQDAEGDRARERLRLRDGRLRLPHAAA